LNSENFQPQQGEMQGKAELSRPGNIQFSNPWPAKIFQLSLATATKVAADGQNPAKRNLWQELAWPSRSRKSAPMLQRF